MYSLGKRAATFNVGKILIREGLEVLSSLCEKGIKGSKIKKSHSILNSDLANYVIDQASGLEHERCI